MPVFLALMSASVFGYVTHHYLGGYSKVLGGFLAFVVWVAVFSTVKRVLNDMRP